MYVLATYEDYVNYVTLYQVFVKGFTVTKNISLLTKGY